MAAVSQVKGPGVGIAGNNGDICSGKEEGCSEFTAKYFQVYSRAREWQELGLDGRWKQTAGIKVSAKLCFFLTSIATVLLNVFLKGSLC